MPVSEILGTELQISKVQVAYLWNLKPLSNFVGQKREKGWGTDPTDNLTGVNSEICKFPIM